MAVTENNLDRTWYLIYTKPRQEQVAQENLLRQGYEIYLPLIRQRKRRSGKYQVIVKPMFPRYLFIRLNTETDNWGPIRSTRGVSGLVRFGMQPAQIPNRLMNSLRDRDDDSGIQDLQVPEYASGNKVRIIEGPMAGCEGIFMAKTGQERVVILLEIAGQTARLNLEAVDLEAVG